MRSSLLKTAKKFHVGLFWLSAVALLAFVLSALTHPMMAWTGPQAKAFMPPKMQLESTQIENISALISDSGIEQSIITKVIPTEIGPMLQITAEVNKPRQYFSLSGENAAQGADYDARQAEWLARYYTGEEAAVKNVSMITEFTHEYPWVNRLLPVYRVDFDNEENLTAYIYTETNALAGLNNDWKRSLQSVFQALHTWSWLDGLPILRVLLIAVLLTALLLMTFSGVVYLLIIKRKSIANVSQRWHRRLAWFAVIPFVGFTISGIYHLFQSEYGEKPKGMRLADPVLIKDMDINVDQLSALTGKSLNGFSLIEHNGKRYFRASVQGNQSVFQKLHQHHSKDEMKLRNQRFDGVAQEKTAFYIALDDTGSDLTDEEVSEALALAYLGLSKDDLIESKKVTRFGGGYDFRNKRLPVWSFEFDTPDGDQLFVDPVTSILVEHTINLQRYERLSFSFLHKWNFMMAFATREQRDIVIVMTLITLLMLGGFGFAYRFRRK